jgi:arsenate reductase
MSQRGILFLCVQNAARSQMAEGLARSLLPASIEVASAGSEPATLHPLAVEVMAEIGIDISDHRSKPIEAIDPARIDTVITLCAEEVCPVFPGRVTRLHWPLPDPSQSGSSGTVRAAFREIRDQLRDRISATLLPVTRTP